jgi:hypothetical protein
MHYGRTAVSLFVFYMLILQGLITSAAWAAPSNGPLIDAICISKASNPIDDLPTAPTRHGRHDACCVFHASGFSAAAAGQSPFIGEAPPSLFYIETPQAFDADRRRDETSTPPLGSRAPPSLI